MFTGIITDIGTIAALSEREQGLRLRIATSYDPATIDLGASIACAGVCLTVTDRGSDQGTNWFEVEAWEEALRLTTISNWHTGTRINLERAMKVGDEYGGHMVSGHVDATAEIISVDDEGEARRFRLHAPDSLIRYIAPKGSVALDGTSLTVNSVDGSVFDVLLIRHSLSVTTWAQRRQGDRVNLEIDQMARYVERYVKHLAQLDKQA
ncbi:MAG: riboflavin synthase [Ahrensia sp.]